MADTNKRPRDTSEEPQNTAKRRRNVRGARTDLPAVFDPSVVNGKELLLGCATRSCADWKAFFKGMVDLTKDGNIYFRNDGAVVRILDSATIALIGLTIKPDAFTEGYNCPRGTVLALNFEVLAKVFSLHSDKKAFAIRVHNETRATFLFKDPESGSTTEHEICQLDINSEFMDIPDELDFETVVRIPTKEFTKIIADLSKFGEVVFIDTAEDKIVFSSTGDNVKKTTMTIYTEGSGAEIVKCAPHTDSYALPYMSKFATLCAASEFVTISFGGDAPLCVSCEMMSGHASMRLFLSPKTVEE